MYRRPSENFLAPLGLLCHNFQIYFENQEFLWLQHTTFSSKDDHQIPNYLNHSNFSFLLKGLNYSHPFVLTKDHQLLWPTPVQPRPDLILWVSPMLRDNKWWCLPITRWTHWLPPNAVILNVQSPVVHPLSPDREPELLAQLEGRPWRGKLPNGD